jgi:catechol 2,3-dioxygenase-like lactoylglutathione lyase family enzyme
MLDHTGFNVSEYQRSKAFYETTLAPLGLSLLMEPAAGSAGFGREQMPFFWIHERPPAVHGGLHIAFTAKDRETVDAFHAAGLEAGGTDNGPPGPRPNYHPNYYGAFILDPDGNNIEAVCHRPE